MKNKLIIIIIMLILLLFAVSTYAFLTIKYKSEKNYYVIIDKNDGSKQEKIYVEVGSKISSLEIPQRNGYTFLYWEVNGEKANVNEKIKNKMKLIAIWEKEVDVEVKEYTITFDSQGGTSVKNQVIKEGEMVIKPTNPTKTGYEFKAWLLNGKEYDFNSKVTQNLTLVASWNKIIKNYTISAIPVDSYSPDVILKVYENGTLISFKSILYEDGTFLCDSNNPTISKIDFEMESSFIIVLPNGEKVNAKKN